MKERPPMWREAANILSHGQPTKGSPADWGLGEVLTIIKQIEFFVAAY
jgi:hypothetical protein